MYKPQGKKTVYEWEYELWEDNTMDIKLIYHAKNVDFSFSDAVKSMMRKTAKAVNIGNTIKVPETFFPWLARQAKTFITPVKLAILQEGAIIRNMKVVKASYDTTDPENWVLTVLIKGTFDRVK